MPTTFVVDKHGVLRFTHLGYDVQLADTLRREIEALAGEP